MGFNSFGKYGEAFDEGRMHFAYVYKALTPTPAAANTFVDLNQTSGLPKYNAFVGSQYTFTPLTGTGNGGIYVGSYGSGSSTKHLMRMQALNPGNASGGTAAPPDYLHLCDYLGFYPLIDSDSIDQQDMDNSTTLTRYTDGAGVRIVLIATAPMSSSATLTISYTNSAGVAGRISSYSVYPATSIGSCATASGSTGAASTVSPFWPLVGGDQGVRSIESMTFSSPCGGFICAALVKPIAGMGILELAVPSEKVFGFEVQNPPEIKPGAYLNFLWLRSNTAAATFSGELIFINS